MEELESKTFKTYDYLSRKLKMGKGTIQCYRTRSYLERTNYKRYVLIEIEKE